MVPLLYAFTKEIVNRIKDASIVAVNLDGAKEAVPNGVNGSERMADPAPTTFTACTLIVYVIPFTNPVIVKEVDADDVIP